MIRSPGGTDYRRSGCCGFRSSKHGKSSGGRAGAGSHEEDLGLAALHDLYHGSPEEMLLLSTSNAERALLFTGWLGACVRRGFPFLPVQGGRDETLKQVKFTMGFVL